MSEFSGVGANARRAADATEYASFPSVCEVRTELERARSRRRGIAAVCMVVGLVLAVFAACVLVFTYVFPVVRVYGSSMTPTLNEGDVVVMLGDSHPDSGDLVAFYYGNDILVKRVVAGPGSWVDILADGTVSVNAVPIQEPYLAQKDVGAPTIELPFQVPEDSYFVMGDNRGASVDSRNALVGAIESSQIIGKLGLRVWPLDRFGLLG